MRSKIFFALVLAWSSTALAQGAAFFGNGQPPVFKEQEPDRRFLKSRIHRLLTEGTSDPNCIQVIGGLLAVLSEVAPTLHKKDENFIIADPALGQAMAAQLNNPRFPGTAYLALMVRRVWLDGRLPPTWLETAAQINPQVRIIDLAKLRLIADGVRPIDSSYFTLSALRDRHEVEVLRATAASTTSELEFRDRYLDRDVAWSQLMVLDIGGERRGPGKKKGKLVDEGAMVANLEWTPPRPEEHQLQLFAPKVKPPVVHVKAKLAAQQYVDLYQLPRGTPVMVRGRLWEMNKQVTELQVRDALLFVERDWSRGAVLADPNAVLQCPAAINELAGLAPTQPGGFAH